MVRTIPFDFLEIIGSLKSNRDLSRGSLKWLETSQGGSLKWLETSLHAGISAYLHFSTPH